MTSRLVYVIDDDPAILRSTAFLLQSAGYDVECFADGDLFVAALPSLRPGCIVTDLRMPNLNGYDLKTALEAMAVAWPMILMTSENGPMITAETERRGFAAYLRKPFSADQLTAALDSGFAMLDGKPA
jgi:two-component system response regulator FixJ